MINFKDLKAIGIDLDGVVCLGSKLIKGAKEAVEKFRKNGLKVFFVTNNSVRTRGELMEKLSTLGIESSLGEVITSGYTAAIFLKKLASRAKVLVIGSEGLKKELSETGLEVVESPSCDFLVVGYDPEFTYEKICQGLDALLGGARFVVCNRVPNFPSEGGKLLPGCGPMVAAIAASSQKEPEFIVGKPNTFMLELITENNPIKPEEILMVGDELEFDIAMANCFGSPAVLISQRDSFASQAESIKPQLVVKSLIDIAERLKTEG